MKQLILVRHAKASMSDSEPKDIDRPLSEKGEQDAPEMARRLSVQNNKPELIVSSSAFRALTTARLFAEEFGISKERIVSQKTLYENTLDGYLQLIQELDSNLQKVMIIGHNPTMTNLVNLLAPALVDGMPTCAIAVINFSFEDWREAGQIYAESATFDFPGNSKGPIILKQKGHHGLDPGPRCV